MNKFLTFIIIIVCCIGLYLFINYTIHNDKSEERNSVLPIFQDHENHEDIPDILSNKE